MPTQTASRKKIEINCTGAATIKLKDLVPLQGNLKRLAPEKHRKLKRELLSRHGFSFPFLVWKNKGKFFILDGHQRDVVLRNLEKQGYEIPPLPVSFVDAADEKEAREKILAVSSQFGDMSKNSVAEFLKLSGIDIADIMDRVEFPQVSIENLLSKMEGEVDPGKPIEYKYQVLVECDNEEHQALCIEYLEKALTIYAAH